MSSRNPAAIRPGVGPGVDWAAAKPIIGARRIGAAAGVNAMENEIREKWEALNERLLVLRDSL
ncbi:MAG: hypothetical protein NTX87_04575 [Planctomycetota bacterium]|nr:hypothetical protein [Planctomycetota bacterium]